MTYLPDIFYCTDRLKKKEVRELFVEAKELSFEWWVDDRPRGIRRKIDMPFEDVLKMFEETLRKKLHIIFIHRRGYENWDHYLEIGFCTLARKQIENDPLVGDIFLWIYVNLEHKDYLVKKYFDGIEDTL